MSAKVVFQHVVEIVGSAIVALMVVGCEVGPNYKRPALDVPGSYRQAQAPDVTAASPNTPSIADEDWPAIAADPALENLIRQALANNLDLRIAAQRVLEAQAQVGVARAQQLPSISGGSSYSALQIPSNLAGTRSDGSPATSFYRGGGFSASAAWNLDFWGLYRRQTEAARAELLASQWGQKATRTALIQGVAEAYFDLRQLDSELLITENTIKARQDSLKLTNALEQHGAGSLADVRQAEELLHAAQANLPDLRRQRSIEENTLSVLLGHNPGDIERGLPVDAQPHPPEITLGLPSDLLERRPDIRQAEAKLIAANARIGVARAQFFPQISLTSMGGTASNQLNAIAAAGNTYWSAAGALSEPIFDGGRIRSNYHLSQAQRRRRPPRPPPLLRRQHQLPRGPHHRHRPLRRAAPPRPGPATGSRIARPGLRRGRRRLEITRRPMHARTAPLAHNSPLHRLPQLDRISFRIMQPRKPAIGVRLRIQSHGNPRRLKLCSHLADIANPKVQHPHLLRIPEVGRTLRKRTEDRHTRLRMPFRRVDTSRRQRNTKVLLVPPSQSIRVFGLEEHTPYPENPLLPSVVGCCSLPCLGHRLCGRTQQC